VNKQPARVVSRPRHNEKGNQMKNRRSWILSLAVVIGALLVPMLLTSDATAGRGQTTMWPKGAQLTATYDYFSLCGCWDVDAQWPAATAADHYRITVIQKSGNKISVILDASPILGLQYSFLYPHYRDTLTIVVTAYSGPDETTAYSESLHTQISLR
jgi:hypothetical protein